MDRSAILVDAGYLLAEGGKAYCGVRGRARVGCDFPAVAATLEDHCQRLHGLPALRTYWYDAARDGVPTEDHLVIAGLPRVKLRLGRLSGGRQKGVDSLIVHDLITLAHERAVASMYLLGGDEDLREGVAAAQRLGIQVVLLGIDVGIANQARTLINEADEHIILSNDVLSGHFSAIPELEEASSPEEGGEVEEPEGAAEVVSGDPNVVAAFGLLADQMRNAGQTFGREWLERADVTQLAELALRMPSIPRELDVQLILAAEQSLQASLRGRQPERHALRAAFWEVIVNAARES